MPVTTLLNKSKVKKFALRMASQERAHKFTRVSPEFVARMESMLAASIAAEVKRLPSLGKTIR